MVVCETKSGPQAVLGDVVIDTTGDIDVAARAGAQFVQDSYLTTLVFRLGGVDTDGRGDVRAGKRQGGAGDQPNDQTALGGAWELWWLKTPSPAWSGATARTWPATTAPTQCP